MQSFFCRGEINNSIYHFVFYCALIGQQAGCLLHWVGIGFKITLRVNLFMKTAFFRERGFQEKNKLQ